MDDYTWNQKMEKRLRRRKKERMSFLFVIVLISGYFMWSFFYASTPEYAMDKVCTAIQNQDEETFEKYVNLELVTGRAYDDLTRDMFATDNNLSDGTKVMFETFYQKIKPQVVSGTADLLKIYVATGQWHAPTGDDILKGRQLGIDYEYLIHRSQLRNTEFVKLVEMQKRGESAEAVVEVRDRSTDTKYNLHIMLEQNADDVWQVVYVSNYRDYLNLLEPIQNSEMTKYIQATSSIVEAYNGRLSTLQNKFSRLVSTGDGKFSESQRKRLAEFVKDELIPVLNDRQSELDMVEVPNGAKYLKELRHQSTEMSVNSWQHFITGMEQDSQDELNLSKAFYKEAADLDYRIGDIIKHTSVSQKAQDVI